MAAKSNNDCCSSRFLSTDEKDRLKWHGSLQNLQSFFRTFLPSTGRYSNEESQGVWKVAIGGQGKPYQGTFKDFVCNFYQTTSTLQVQGKNRASIVSKLKEILTNPVTFGESRPLCPELLLSAKENQNKALKQTGLEEEQDIPGLGNRNNMTEADIPNGMVRGKDVKVVVESKLKQWDNNSSKIVVVSPFLDPKSLNFIVNAIHDKTDIEIYVRKDCHWNSNIEEVIIKSRLSDHWILKHINAVKAMNNKPPFHAKFVAGVSNKNDTVDLVLTSCNLTQDHLDSNQLETLERKTLSLTSFNEQWMQPLQQVCLGNTLVFVNDVEELSSLMKNQHL